MTIGMVCGAVGVALMARLDDSSGYLTLLPGFLLFGIALGFVYSPMSIAAMEAMPRAKAGIAAGVLAMNRVLAGAVLLAATGAIFAALMDSHNATYSLAHALWATIALLIVGAALTFWLVANPPRDPDAPPKHHRHPHTLPH
jgi:MFS family permease